MLSGSRTVGVDVGDAERLGDDVLVLDRHDRDVHPGQPPDPPAGGARRDDHGLGLDRPCSAPSARRTARDLAARHVEPRHRTPGEDPHAELLGPRRERPGQQRRVEPAVAGQPERGAARRAVSSSGSISAASAPESSVQAQAVGLAGARLPQRLLHPLGRGRQAQAADPVPAGVQSGQLGAARDRDRPNT